MSADLLALELTAHPRWTWRRNLAVRPVLANGTVDRRPHYNGSKQIAEGPTEGEAVVAALIAIGHHRDRPRQFHQLQFARLGGRRHRQFIPLARQNQRRGRVGFNISCLFAHLLVRFVFLLVD